MAYIILSSSKSDTIFMSVLESILVTWFNNRDKTYMGTFFAFGTMHFLQVNQKPTNALIIQCISSQYSPTCFGTLKFHNQGVKHDPAEIGAQCRGKHSRMGAVYCDRRRDGGDITE
jgi:hypothetical protein